MRRLVVFALVAMLRLPALAVCPGPDCFAGGRPAATDCFVAFGGMSSKTLTCTDGAACDLDGKVDGTCMLDLQACINVPGLPGCNPAGLGAAPTVAPAASPTAQQLAAALGALDRASSGCTAPGLALPLKLSLAGIKTGKARLTVTATSGGKRDTDHLQLACAPSTTAPSFSQAIQPIFNAKCAYSGCHDSFAPAGRPILVAGMAYAQTVDAKATLGKLLRVKRGSIRGSDLAHRILGQGIPAGGTQMPQGCPTVVPPGCPAGTVEACCLTTDEKFTILSWIANGAPDD